MPAMVLRSHRLALGCILLTALMDSIGFGIILPVLPELVMELTGGGLSQAARYGGWLMFVFATMQFFFSPVLGNLSDRFGRRPVLLFSLCMLGVNYLIMGWAPTLGWLFFGRMISGLASSTMSTCNAFIADISPPEERTQNFGLVGAAFGMGFVIGPVIGGFLGELGPRAPFFAAAGFAFGNMLFGLLVLPETLKEEHRRPFDVARANPLGTLKQLRAFPMVFGLLGVMFLYNMGHHVLPATWSFFTMERFGWSEREVGYSLGAVGILMVLVQGFLIRVVISRTGPRIAVFAGMTFTTVAFIGYAMATQGWMIYAALVPGALGALAGPAINGIASTQVGAGQQGELQGGLASIMSLASILSPPLMTETFGFFAAAAAPLYFPGAPYILAAALTVLSLALFVRATSGLVLQRDLA